MNSKKYLKPKIDKTSVRDGEKMEIASFYYRHYDDSLISEKIEFDVVKARHTKHKIKFDFINKPSHASFGISRINHMFVYPSDKEKKSFCIGFVCLRKHFKEYISKADEVIKSKGIKLLELYPN